MNEQVAQADNRLCVYITEWLIKNDALDEENTVRIERFGAFIEPLLARHRQAAIAAVIAQATSEVSINRARLAWRDTVEASEDTLDIEIPMKAAITAALTGVQ